RPLTLRARASGVGRSGRSNAAAQFFLRCAAFGRKHPLTSYALDLPHGRSRAFLFAGLDSASLSAHGLRARCQRPRRPSLRERMRNMSRITFRQIALSLAFVCLCFGLASAQTGMAELAGRVVDPQGAGVAGAIVTIYTRAPRLRLTTRTDAAGAYRFTQLAPGEYLVEADAHTFAPAPARTVQLMRGQTGTLDLALEVAALREEVVVTAADAPQTIDEVSKATSVVTRREMDERDEFLLPEALRTVPGLRVQQLGGPGALTTIKTRGLRNQDTAVLIDGLRFRDPSAPQGDAEGYLSDLLVTNTSRVEVLRGSGSSLYGTNAIGGVINIV